MLVICRLIGTTRRVYFIPVFIACKNRKENCIPSFAYDICWLFVVYQVKSGITRIAYFFPVSIVCKNRKGNCIPLFAYDICWLFVVYQVESGTTRCSLLYKPK